MKNFKEYITTINEWKLSDQSVNNVDLEELFDSKEAEKQKTLDDLFKNVIIKKYNQLTNSTDQISYDVHTFRYTHGAYLLYSRMSDYIKSKYAYDIEDMECCFSIKFKGDSKLVMHGLYIENDFLGFGFDFPGKTRIIDSIFTKLNFSVVKSEYKYDKTKLYMYNNKKCDKKLFSILICKILFNLVKELGIRNDIDRTLKPGEVLPGYTFEDIKNRYDNIFDEVRLMRTGNVNLGHLYQSGYYGDDKFVIYCNIDFNNGVLIRRTRYGQTSQFIHKPDADTAFDAFDAILRKRGYNI